MGREFRAHELRHWRSHGRSGSRRARLGVRKKTRHRDQAGDRAIGWQRDRYSGGGVRRQGRPREFRRMGRHELRDRLQFDRRSLREHRPRPANRELSPARLGRFSAALLGSADTDYLLRRLRRGAGTGAGPAGRFARRCACYGRRVATQGYARICECRLPELRQGCSARNRHVRHVCRVVVVLRALCLSG